MRKNTLNFIVDLATLLAILVMVGTGLIMKFTLPPGSGSRGLVLWSMTRHEWGDVHFWASVALAALLVLHVALHWAWVCGTIRRLVNGPSVHRGAARGRLDNVYGIAFFVLVAAAATALVFTANAGVARSETAAQEHEREHESARQVSPGIGRGSGAHEEFDVHIRGSMTCRDVAAQTGISVPDLLDILGWPPDTPPNEQLGRLSRAHGTDMTTVRATILQQRAATPPEP